MIKVVWQEGTTRSQTQRRPKEVDLRSCKSHGSIQMVSDIYRRTGIKTRTHTRQQALAKVRYVCEGDVS